MDSSNVTAPSIPDHVPPELVREFQFDKAPGIDVDCFNAVLNQVRDWPEIFYAPNSRRGKNTWVVTRHDLIREVYQTPDLFSSHRNGDFASVIGEDWLALPLEADPPVHAGWRMLLNPIFAPARMKAMEDQITELANDLLDEIAPKGAAEFTSEFGIVFPVRIFLRLFGLPLEDATGFLEWERMLVHGTMDERRAGAKAIVAYLRQVLAERREQPRDDLISYVATAQIDGRLLEPDEALGMAFLLYAAGLDTVANTLAFMFRHLAEHPDDQQMLRDDPSLVPQAIEELMRAYPIVISGREVTRDVEWQGVKMKAGDMVSVATMFAGRDGREFPEPHKVDFRRQNVTHISFAAGPHRCVGSHLARRELRIAMETWLKRVPPFRIAPGDRAVTYGLGAFGIEHLPLVWDAN
jgi:cytochrome P450